MHESVLNRVIYGGNAGSRMNDVRLVLKEAILRVNYMRRFHYSSFFFFILMQLGLSEKSCQKQRLPSYSSSYELLRQRSTCIWAKR